MRDKNGLGAGGWGLGLLSLAATLSAQQPPTFTGVNRTVAVYATVTDAGGRLVPDLAREQFQIDDNGRKQELTIFANEIQPITVVMLLDRPAGPTPQFCPGAAVMTDIKRN